MTGLHLAPLDLAGVERLYPTMAADFPPSELKSLDKLNRLYRQGLSQGYLLMEGESPRGYAFFLHIPGETMPLLDYYAILPAFRGRGLGSQGLALLQAGYPGGFFLEAEDPAAADTQEEEQIRLRRVAFYQRAGFLPCPFENTVFGVRYLVHLWGTDIPPERSRRGAELLAAAYRCQLSPEVFRREIQIKIP